MTLVNKNNLLSDISKDNVYLWLYYSILAFCSQVEILLFDHFDQASMLVIYFFVSRINGIMNIFVNNTSLFLASKISFHTEVSKVKYIINYSIYLSCILLLLSIIVTGVMVFLPLPKFSNQQASVSVMFLILSIGTVFNLRLAPYSSILVANNRGYDLFIISLFVSIIFMLLKIYLVYELGSYGACISSAGYLIILNYFFKIKAERYAT